MGWPGVTRIVAGRFVRFRAAEKSAKWRQIVTLRHCWHPRTLFLLAQNGLEPPAVGAFRGRWLTLTWVMTGRLPANYQAAS
jgi:hypothetical protein